jgi:hypothetical protein
MRRIEVTLDRFVRRKPCMISVRRVRSSAWVPLSIRRPTDWIPPVAHADERASRSGCRQTIRLPEWTSPGSWPPAYLALPSLKLRMRHGAGQTTVPEGR